MTARATMTVIGLATALTAVFVHPSPCQQPPMPQKADTLQRMLDAAIDRDVIGAFMRLEDGGEVRQYTAGSAVAGEHVRVDPNGHLRIGSITKTFVATVVMQLVDEGRIGLDDPVQSVLFGVLPSDYPPITVRQLLQHSSGIPNYTPRVMETPERIVADRDRTWTRDELLAIAFSQPREFEPGTRMGYSNTNYVLLGLMIESLTGTTWEDAVDRRIVRPLGLSSTFTPGHDPALPEPHSHGYVTVPVGNDSMLVDITAMSMTSTDAAGSMISTAGDLDRFFDALLGGELVSAGRLEEMLRPGEGSLVEIPGVGWALGLLTVELPPECGKETIYGNAGGTAGFTGIAVGTRDREFSMVLYMNTAGPAFHPPRSEKLVRITRAAMCGRGR